MATLTGLGYYQILNIGVSLVLVLRNFLIFAHFSPFPKIYICNTFEYMNNTFETILKEYLTITQFVLNI